jgi:aminomuconate-semialdehyde/2-hydroxymuconate-6-semialdehyde dehydrogenase
MLKIDNFINGKFTPPAGGQYLDNTDPATGVAYSLVANSDSPDVHHAAAAAASAFPSWASMSTERRSALLMRLADLIDRDCEKLAMAESLDNGKPVALARRLDIPRAASNIRFFATAIVHFASEAHITGDQAVNYTLRTPVGVAGCISPWNLPLYLFTWKIAPALAAGCTVVGKPSELTPMTAYLLAELCGEAGIPPGVLNIVHGLGQRVGQALVEDHRIAAVSFTGGTVTGKKVASTAAPMFKKLSLELGGKNPNIIFDDCDFEKALSSTIRSSFSNQGEICLCGSRILVSRKLFDRFVHAFAERTKALRTGDPSDEATDIGAVISEQHLQKILSYIELAREEGGTIIAGGNRITLKGRCSGGFFIEPTIITGLDQRCRTNQEEIFGPVVTIAPFDSDDEAIDQANSTVYGLSASVWTENLQRAHRVAARLNSGIIWINCWLFRDLRTPFGGMKQSGVGREGGWEALRFFTEARNVCVRL